MEAINKLIAEYNTAQIELRQEQIQKEAVRIEELLSDLHKCLEEIYGKDVLSEIVEHTQSVRYSISFDKIIVRLSFPKHYPIEISYRDLESAYISVCAPQRSYNLNLVLNLDFMPIEDLALAVVSAEQLEFDNYYPTSL